METTAGLFDAECVRADATAASRLLHPSAGDAAALRSAFVAAGESARRASVVDVEIDLPFVWVG